MATKAELQEIINALADWYDQTDAGPNGYALLFGDNTTLADRIQDARTDA